MSVKSLEAPPGFGPEIGDLQTGFDQPAFFGDGGGIAAM